MRIWQHLCNKVSESIKDRFKPYKHTSPDDDEKTRITNDSILMDAIWNMEDLELLKFIFN